MRTAALCAISACILATSARPSAQNQPAAALQRPPNVERTFSTPDTYVPDVTPLVAATSELRDTVDRFAADRQAIQRFYNVPGSRERPQALQRL